MPLKDHFRRAIGRPSRSSSNSSSSITDTNPSATPPISTTTTATATPTPSISLTKTSSRLSKTLTWTSKRSRNESKREKQLEDWEKKDEQEWREPKTKYPGRKSKAHQDMLRAFEWKMRDGRPSLEGGREERRRWSGWSVGSGVSPGTSRMNSVEEGQAPRRIGSASRKRSGGLSREVTRDEGVEGLEMVDTVQEE